MAKKSSAMLELKGFDEFYEKLEQMTKIADEIAEEKFNECIDVLENELRTEAQASLLDPSLVAKIQRETNYRFEIWSGKVGWKSDGRGVGNPLSDFLKVVIYNYGTPKERFVKVKNIRNKYYDQWRTLGMSRGKIEKHGFIERAKENAGKKTKALMKKALKEIMDMGR